MITFSDNTTNSFSYDGDGLRRVMTDNNSVVTRFIWDGQKVISETNDSGSTQVTYTLSDDQYGSLISQRRSDTSKFYLYDGLGSTDRLLAADETITDNLSTSEYRSGASTTALGPPSAHVTSMRMASKGSSQPAIDMLVAARSAVSTRVSSVGGAVKQPNIQRSVRFGQSADSGCLAVGVIQAAQDRLGHQRLRDVYG